MTYGPLGLLEEEIYIFSLMCEKLDHKHMQSQLLHLNAIPGKTHPLQLLYPLWFAASKGLLKQAVKFVQRSPLKTWSVLALRYVRDKDVLSGTKCIWTLLFWSLLILLWMRCEIVIAVAFHPEPRGLCCDPREDWAGSKQLPIPFLSISGADNLASAVTLISGFIFF